MRTILPRRLYNKQYDPALFPPTNTLRKQRGTYSLEWLWQRPDPAPVPKVIVRDGVELQTRDGRVADGVAFCEIVRPQPMHAHLHQLSKSQVVPQTVIDKLMPPIVYDHHGKYQPRKLSATDVQQMRQLRLKNPSKYKPKKLGERFKCSKEQAARVVERKTNSMSYKLDRKWNWWDLRPYAKARIEQK